MVKKFLEYGKFILVINVLFLLVFLTACKTEKAAVTPFPDLKEWDLLIISDSSNWGVGKYYAQHIEEDMNVKVNLHDCWVGAMTIGAALEALQSGGSLEPYLGDPYCERPWADIIEEAEVMVLHGSPVDSLPPDGSWEVSESYLQCESGGYIGENQLPGFETFKKNMLKSCAPATFATYQAHLGAFLDEIDKIREGRPLILRLTSIYIPLHSYWKMADLDEVCTQCFRNYEKAILQVAREHGVPVADYMAGFNGKDRMLDPSEAGYFGVDQIHLSDLGAQFAASILRQTGYEYAGK